MAYHRGPHRSTRVNQKAGEKGGSVSKSLYCVFHRTEWMKQSKQFNFSSVQLVSQSCATFCDPMDCSRWVLPAHHQLTWLAQIHVRWVSDAIQPSHSLLSSSPPDLHLSQHQGLFQSVSSSFSISLSNENSGLIPFRIDWLDPLSVQGTLKSLLQHHSSKASILRCSAFFIFQLSHPQLTTGKTIALTRQTFVGKIMSLLFNTLSRLVIAFFQRGIIF